MNRWLRRLLVLLFLAGLFPPARAIVITSSRYPVGNPKFHLSATCSDLGPQCTQLSIQYYLNYDNPQTDQHIEGWFGVASGPEPFDGEVEIPQILFFSPAPFRIVAGDASGKSLGVLNFTAYAEPNTYFQPEATVDGLAVDFDASRLLYASPARPDGVQDGYKLYIRDRATAADTQIYETGSTNILAVGFLTPTGAIFKGGDGNLYEWRDNAVSPYSGPFVDPSYPVTSPEGVTSNNGWSVDKNHSPDELRTPWGEIWTAPNAGRPTLLGPNGDYLSLRSRGLEDPDHSDTVLGGYLRPQLINVGTGLARYFWRGGRLKAALGNTFFNIGVDPLDRPVALGQTVSGGRNVPIPLTLTARDRQGRALEYSIVTPPAHGTLSGSIPNLTYTSLKGYSGSDSFTFRAAIGESVSDPATLTINLVNLAPVAANMDVATPENTTLQFVLNGTDADGDALKSYIYAYPNHGSVRQAGNSVTYTPQTGFSGKDEIRYFVNDGQLDSKVATVRITVGAPNDPPVAQDLSIVAYRERPVDFTLPASDPNGDALAYTVAAPPAHGTLSGTAPALTYTPAPDYTGPDSFGYGVNDGRGLSASATVTLDVRLAYLTIGDATAETRKAGEVSVALTDALSGATALDLYLKAVGPDGAPPLTPSFSLATAASDWTLATDPADPWHVTLTGGTPLSGPADALRVTLLSDPSATVGTKYQLEASAAYVSSTVGFNHADVTGFAAPGGLEIVAPPAPGKGDPNGDGTVDVSDAVYVLQAIVGLVTPDAAAQASSDANCDGEVTISDAVLVLRHIVLGDPFPCG